jgi:acyl carrier protein
MQTKQTVIEVVTDVLGQKGRAAPDLAERTLLVDDLGLDSMDLAVIVATMETKTGSDPFADRVSIATVRTLGDLWQAYASSEAAAE